MIELKHKKLTVYQKSLEIVTQVYDLTNELPDSEKFGLISQMRRASVSIPANISEGASRTTTKDRTRFYVVARSSLVELDPHFEVCIKLGFLKPTHLKQLRQLANEVFAMLSKLIQTA